MSDRVYKVITPPPPTSTLYKSRAIVQVSVDGRTVGAVLYEDGSEKQTQWTFPLYGLKGQRVRVMHRGDYLVLCEVQVMSKCGFRYSSLSSSYSLVGWNIL